jgi:hypothetical protein
MMRNEGQMGSTTSSMQMLFRKIGIIRVNDLLEVESAEKLQELTELNWGLANGS